MIPQTNSRLVGGVLVHRFDLQLEARGTTAPNVVPPEVTTPDNYASDFPPEVTTLDDVDGGVLETLPPSSEDGEGFETLPPSRDEESFEDAATSTEMTSSAKLRAHLPLVSSRTIFWDDDPADNAAFDVENSTDTGVGATGVDELDARRATGSACCYGAGEGGSDVPLTPSPQGLSSEQAAVVGDSSFSHRHPAGGGNSSSSCHSPAVVGDSSSSQHGAEGEQVRDVIAEEVIFTAPSGLVFEARLIQSPHADGKAAASSNDGADSSLTASPVPSASVEEYPSQGSMADVSTEVVLNNGSSQPTRPTSFVSTATREEKQEQGHERARTGDKKNREQRQEVGKKEQEGQASLSNPSPSSKLGSGVPVLAEHYLAEREAEDQELVAEIEVENGPLEGVAEDRPLEEDGADDYGVRTARVDDMMPPVVDPVIDDRVDCSTDHMAVDEAQIDEPLAAGMPMGDQDQHVEEVPVVRPEIAAPRLAAEGRFHHQAEKGPRTPSAEEAVVGAGLVAEEAALVAEEAELVAEEAALVDEAENAEAENAQPLAEAEAPPQQAEPLAEAEDEAEPLHQVPEHPLLGIIPAINRDTAGTSEIRGDLSSSEDSSAGRNAQGRGSGASAGTVGVSGDQPVFGPEYNRPVHQPEVATIYQNSADGLEQQFQQLAIVTATTTIPNYAAGPASGASMGHSEEGGELGAPGPRKREDGQNALQQSMSSTSGDQQTTMATSKIEQQSASSTSGDRRVPSSVAEAQEDGKPGRPKRQGRNRNKRKSNSSGANQGEEHTSSRQVSASGSDRRGGGHS
ncbi:unnamed protein product [Amoebophrya sp. A25]|nr:unnamed protein product [Amoebophrya sp. A25]|eukprot:GSA25T00007477001.1